MTSPSGDLLTVVIPAYKRAYLGAALDSLRAQTSRGFRVVVADDASPEDLQPIVERSGAGLNLVYERFDRNLGGADLTAHWNRAVRLAWTDWILLLGDDDLLDPDAVAGFYSVLDETRAAFDLYRFSTRRIDGAGNVVAVHDAHPREESALAFLEERLHERRSSFTCEYLFRRSAWERIGGFVSFPLAWCSDDATWLALGAECGIRAIEGPRASWRLSNDNISSRRPELALAKLRARSLFAKWLATDLQGVDRRALERLRPDVAGWFNNALWKSGCIVPLGPGLEMSRNLNEFTRLGPLWHLARILKHDWDHGRTPSAQRPQGGG